MPSRRDKKNPSKSLRPRKKTGRRKKKQQSKRMPVWLRNVLLLLIVIFFSSAGYYFFIRPYRFVWKDCRGDKAYNVCMPCCYDIHGIDVSHHQGSIDWRKLSERRVEKYPIEFVFVKATEGTDHLDTAFEFNFEEARNHSFIRGAYHFFSSRTEPDLQAQNFIETVRLMPGDLPPVLHVNEAKHSARNELQRRQKVWLDIVENHYGVKPIMYPPYNLMTKPLTAKVFDSYPN